MLCVAKSRQRLTFSSTRISQRYRGELKRIHSQTQYDIHSVPACRAVDLQNSNYMFIIPILFVKIIISEYASEPQADIQNIYAAFCYGRFYRFFFFCVCFLCFVCVRATVCVLKTKTRLHNN